MYNEYTRMRNYYFEKGEQIKGLHLSLAIVTHKLDMCTYGLERVEEPGPNYVTDFYTGISHHNLLRYMTCWFEM